MILSELLNAEGQHGHGGLSGLQGCTDSVNRSVSVFTFHARPLQLVSPPSTESRIPLELKQFRSRYTGPDRQGRVRESDRPSETELKNQKMKQTPTGLNQLWLGSQGGWHIGILLCNISKHVLMIRLKILHPILE